MRDAEKGPLVVEVAICKVQTKINRCNMKYNEYLVIVHARRGRQVQIRLLFLERTARNRASRIRTRCLCRSSNRGVHQARQKRSGPCRLRSSQLARLASSSGVVNISNLVFGGRNRTGEKMDSCDYSSTNSRRLGDGALCEFELPDNRTNIPRQIATITPQRRSKILSPQKP